MINNSLLNIVNSIQKKLLITNDKLIVCMYPINITKKNSNIGNNISKFLESDFFFLRIIFLLLINLIKFFLIYIKVFFYILISDSKKVINSEIIFLSHRFENNSNDIYFSEIKKNIKNNNHQTIYIDQLNFFNLKKQSQNLIKSHNCNLKDYKNMFFEIFTIFFEVFIFLINSKKREKKVVAYLLCYVFSTATIRNYLIYLNLKQILNSNILRKIILTFEGHVYEKYLSLQFKKKLSKIEVIGYQHTGLNGYENSLYNPNLEKFLPNKILCISPTDMKIIKKKTRMKNIFNIGRHLSQKTKKNWKLINQKNKIPRILILVENETEIISNFFSKIKNYKNLVNITIRPHPEQLNLVKQKLNIPNVKFSNLKNFRDDLKKNDVLIFQNSTIHYEAIRYGLLTLRLKTDVELLFMKKKMETKIKIVNLEEVIMKIKNIRNFNYKNYLKYAEMKFPNLNISELNSVL